MIKNEQQYRLTKAQASKFAVAIESYASQAEEHPIKKEVYLDAMRSQYEELMQLVNEYDRLKTEDIKAFKIESFDELPRTLIKARIVSGLSQKDLADLLDMKEQQIQRYEATDYSGASFERLKEIIRALKLIVKEEVFVSSEIISKANFFKNLADLGFQKDFVLRKLLPRRLAANLEISAGNSEMDTSPFILQSANFIEKVFKIKANQLLGKGQVGIDFSIAYNTYFKKPKNADVNKIAPYTIYAQILAITLLEATKHIIKKEIPNNYEVFRNCVIEQYGKLNFETTLRYTWNLGIPVLPLEDSKNFHGACWRVDGRNVIVLKQKTNSSVRWLFDLLHEIRHAAQHTDQLTLDFIEGDDDFNREMIRSNDEKEANYFAGQVILNGRANELSLKVVKAVDHKGPFLKSKTIEVAQEEGVEAGALANYIAFRLMVEQGFNWWGTANNLQTNDAEPWEVAKRVLLENTDFSNLPDVERELLVNALT